MAASNENLYFDIFFQLGTATPDKKFRMFTKEEIETLVQEIK